VWLCFSCFVLVGGGGGGGGGVDKTSFFGNLFIVLASY